MTFTTGAVTTIAAGTATAGHILAMRSDSTPGAIRLRSFEPEFILTTAFGAAQEVGFDMLIARGYTAAHTGATALTMTGGGMTDQSATILTGRIADAGALTAGTHTLDANPIAKGSQWCSAVGAALQPRVYDFTSSPRGGIILAADEGFVVRNTILMGATGVGKWHFTLEWDDCVI
jgi:hypothetical protein